MHVHADARRSEPRADWRIRASAAAGVAAAAGVLAGWLMPRGAVTSWQAITAMATAVIVGAAAGWFLRSRWAVLLAPATFMMVFELARIRVDGPTVDAIRIDSLYGLMALIAGRGIDGIIVVLPMIVGVSYGVSLAARSGLPAVTPRRRQLIRRTLLVLMSLALIALAAGFARPASTDAIVGADGKPVPGSIAELTEVEIGGHDQSIMIRGQDVASPVLLFLEGGPGGTGLGRIRNSGEDLEKDFVVATWDQRGAGKSYDSLEPASTLTLEQMVDDTLEVTNYLRQRFDEQKIYLVGSSWGTTIGVLAVQRSPELFHAYVGTGQMVDQFETDKLMYAESLADAEARGDQGMADALREIGEPPYEDTLDYTTALASNPKWIDFAHGADYEPSSEYPFSLFVREYTLIEQMRGMAAIAETFAVLYPQLGDIDFRIDVPHLDVPVYVLEGKYEAAGRETLARQWFASLSAPIKRYVVFANSGHTPQYDEPGRFAEFMGEVLRATGRH